LTGILLAAILAGMLVVAATASAAPSAPYFVALPASGASATQSPRDYGVVATLPDGQVLIAGGIDEHYAGFILQSAELFNPTNDTFTALEASGASELQSRRFGAVAATLPDGQVLIAGGANLSNEEQQSAELFNPASDTFTMLAGGEQTGRVFAAAATLPDGQVLIAGGTNRYGYAQSAELFNPETETFTTLASGEQANRKEAVAATLPNGQVLIADGENREFLFGPSGETAELFNPETDTFTMLASDSRTDRQGASAATLPDGQVLIVGGQNEDGQQEIAELFDPANDTFTTLASREQTPRLAPAEATLPDGQVLIAGGANQSGEPQSAELYFSAPEASAPPGEFGDQTVEEPSPVSQLSVSNVGAQALKIGSATIAGSDPADFQITDDACAGRTLAFEQSCTISVRFTPSATGERTASVALADNEQSPSEIQLTGNGVAAGSGPGKEGKEGKEGTQGKEGKEGKEGAEGKEGKEGAGGKEGAEGKEGKEGKEGAEGKQGAKGESGPIGAAGTNGLPGIAGTNGTAGTDGLPGAIGPGGPAGATGPRGAPGVAGPAGQIELVSCKTLTSGKGKHKKTRQSCSSRLTSSPLKIATTKALLRASLSRASRIYATGSALASAEQTQLFLTPRRKLAEGAYTLTLTSANKRRRETITLG
jgi:N-acetylneuraminic acid mutarotase